MNTFLASLKGYGSRAYGWMKLHKVLSAFVLIVLVAGGYQTYAVHAKSAAGTQYVLTTATRGTITVSVSGSGQVEANQTLELSPKSSGEITYVGVKAGDTVSAGEVIARVDDADAEKSLRDAEASLTSAKISYQQSVASANTNSDTSVNSAYSSATTVLTDLPGIMKDLDSAIGSQSTLPGHTDQDYIDAYAAIMGTSGPAMSASVEAEYRTALADYQTLEQVSSGVSRTSSDEDIKGLIDAAYTAAMSASSAAGDLHDLMNQVNDKEIRADATIPASFTTLISTIASDAAKANSDTSSALSAKNDLADSMATLGGSGSVPLDIQSAQLSLTKAENSVTDAEDNLEDYVVRAPFSGTIAQVSAQVHDQSTSDVATLITNEEDAKLSLNEVDAAKVKSGQKVALTFDAIDGLTLDGTVAEVDSVGTVTQGVVTYSVKISFDTQDSRVKPGMTVNAVITTASKENALLVPSSAVTTSNGKSYVQVVTGAGATASTTGYRNRTASSSSEFASSTRRFGMNSTTPAFGTGSTSSSTEGFTRAGAAQTVLASSVTVTRVPVEVGLTSDTQAEIVSGIEDGAMVVERTVAAGTTAAATTGTTGAAAAGRTTTARPAGGFGGAARGFGG